jgi:hypothetical protein
MPSKNRKALDPENSTCIFVVYPDGVKGYMLIYPSTDKLIIEQSVQFEEMHAPLETHAKTSILAPAPDIIYDESTHSNHGSDLSSEFDSEYDEHVDDEPQQILKWECSSGNIPPYMQHVTLWGIQRIRE